MAMPTTEIDRRFGNPRAHPTPWGEAESVLRGAELYWLTTVRSGGRPHVTPLVGVWVAGAFAFTTGPGEQKARNLDRNAEVAVTTGANAWASGLDVVVEGTAVRVSDHAALERIADAYDGKYSGQWHWEVRGGEFVADEMRSLVFRVAPDKVLAFGKDPHSQTRYRFG